MPTLVQKLLQIQELSHLLEKNVSITRGEAIKRFKLSIWFNETLAKFLQQLEFNTVGRDEKGRVFFY